MNNFDHISLTSTDDIYKDINVQEMLDTIRGHVKRMQDNPTVKLFVVSPADYQWLRDNLKERTKDVQPLWTVGDPLNAAMGVPVWRSVGLEAGDIRSYRTWAEALKDLKELGAPDIDLEFLEAQAKLEAEHAIS